MNVIIYTICVILDIVFLGLFISFMIKDSKYKFLILYLMIWITFGLSYFFLAGIDGERNFIFNDEIQIESLTQSIYERFDKSYRKDNIEYIVRNNLDNKTVINQVYGSDEVIYICNEEIGYGWARLYSDYYMDKGYTHYKVDSIEIISNLTANPNILIEKLVNDEFSEINHKDSTEYYLHRIILYSSTPEYEKILMMMKLWKPC